MGLKYLLASVCFSAAAIAALPDTAKVPPLEAKLARSVDARALKVGDEVLFTAAEDWSAGACHLASGAAIHGNVVAVQVGPGTKHEQIALSFLNPCDTSGGAKLFWLALLGPEDAALRGVHERSSVVQAFRSPTFGEGGTRSTGGSMTGDATLSGRDAPTYPLFSGSNEAAPEPRPQFIRPGQVWHLPHLTLRPAGGPAESSLLASTSGRLRIPAGSLFVLVGDPRPAPAAMAHPVAQTLPTAIPALALCHAPACSVAKFDQPRSPRPLLTLPLAETGYKPSAEAESTQLSYKAALSFLGETQLLLVFPSRALMQRDHRDGPEDHPHMLTAVVFDLPDGKMHKRPSFRVADDKQCLWPLPDGHVLLHIENSLRWLGPDLREERVLPLGGPLAFLRLSPDGSHYAVGVTEEMHQPAEHQSLAASDASGPEERVRVRILDSSLAVLDEEVASSRLLPPTLVNDGTIQIRHLPSGDFYLQQQDWHRASHREFARVASTCIPHLDSAAPDLLALETCTRSGLDRPFTILTSAGVPVLSGTTHARQFTPLLGDPVASRYFPLAVVEGGANFVRDSQFHPEDLARETIALFDATDGHLAAGVPVRSPLPIHQPFAVSASGGSLAVLDGDHIAVYSAAQLVPPQAMPPLQAGSAGGTSAGINAKNSQAAAPSP